MVKKTERMMKKWGVGELLCRPLANRRDFVSHNPTICLKGTNGMDKCHGHSCIFTYKVEKNWTYSKEASKS